MSTDRDVTRIVRSWLSADEHESADRVLDAVLDQLDATTQRRATWWPARRTATMNNAMRFGLSAAAISVLAVGIAFVAGGGSFGEAIDATPSPAAGSVDPTPRPTPTPLAEPTTLPASGSLVRGTYIIGDPFPIQVSVPLTDDWGIWGGNSIHGAALYQVSYDPPRGRGIIVTIVPNLAADACAGAEEMDPPLGPSVDELAEGLAAQPFTDASAITDVTLSGYAGKHVEYSFEGGDGDCARLARFSNVLGTREAIINEHDEVWILDVEGQRIMIDAFWFSDVTDAELEELRGIVEAIEINP